MDVEPTALVISAAAVRLRDAADDLDRMAKRMRASQDITYASEAVSTIVNCMATTRLDLLVTRPIRGLMRDHATP
jgi:hypothetical protein